VKPHLSVAVVTAVVTLSAATSAWALKPIKTTWFGIAIKGYDPVAYFTDGKPVKGLYEHRLDWQGAEWRFASREHLDLFKADPARYAPQYGGYCAWAVAQNDTAGIDPAAWRIVDGKLYLNYNDKIQARWEADIPGNITKADANWPGLLKK
jgi:YHS domain-containing protein